MRRRVLLAASDSDLIAQLQKVLQARNYLMLVAPDHATAQELALVQQPLVIIIDLDLPDGTGRDLARSLRQHRDTLSQPVILLAGQPSQDDYRFAFAQGVAKFITKPLRPVELIHAVDELVDRCRFQHA